MLTLLECQERLKNNLPYIQKENGVTGLCLFGSVARGDNRSDSDVDILVDMHPKLVLMSGLKRFLEELLGASVDLIRHHAHLSARFLNQISSDAIILL